MYCSKEIVEEIRVDWNLQKTEPKLSFRIWIQHSVLKEFLLTLLIKLLIAYVDIGKAIYEPVDGEEDSFLYFYLNQAQ